MEERGQELSSGVEATEDTLGVGVTDGSVDAPDIEGLDSDDISGLTTREITERALEEAKAEAEGARGEGASGRKEQQEKPVAAEQVGQELPPSRMSATEKEAFNQLPPQLKASVARMFRDHDRQFHNTQREFARVAQAAQGLVQNVDKYLMQRPRLVEAGYTSAGLVNQLLAAHMALENPETKLAKFAEIAGQLGLSDQEFMQVGYHIGMGHVFGQGQGQPSTPDISNHPYVRQLETQISALQQKTDAVYSGYEQQQRQQFDAEVGRNVSEAEALRNQKDRFGRFIYPELHDDGFLDQVKPLVSALRNAIPGLSFGEAIKRAYYTVKGSFPAGNLPEGNQAKLPAQANLTRATRAANTARGGAAPSALQADSSDEPPPDVMSRGTRAITEWSLARIRAGAGR